MFTCRTWSFPSFFMTNKICLFLTIVNHSYLNLKNSKIQALWSVFLFLSFFLLFFSTTCIILSNIMSFMGEGSADCGPVNPMAGLMKQFGQDRSLQQVYMQAENRDTECSPTAWYIYVYRIVLALSKEERVPR